MNKGDVMFKFISILVLGFFLFIQSNLHALEIEPYIGTIASGDSDVAFAETGTFINYNYNGKGKSTGSGFGLRMSMTFLLLFGLGYQYEQGTLSYNYTGSYNVTGTVFQWEWSDTFKRKMHAPFLHISLLDMFKVGAAYYILDYEDSSKLTDRGVIGSSNGDTFSGNGYGIFARSMIKGAQLSIEYRKLKLEDYTIKTISNPNTTSRASTKYETSEIFVSVGIPFSIF